MTEETTDLNFTDALKAVIAAHKDFKENRIEGLKQVDQEGNMKRRARWDEAANNAVKTVTTAKEAKLLTGVIRVGNTSAKTLLATKLNELEAEKV